MRKIMRETLAIMISGGYGSIFLGKEPSGEVSAWSYADFASLRPRVAAESWRGMMARFVKEGVVQRVLTEQGVGFRLTRLGVRNHFAFLPAQSPDLSAKHGWMAIVTSPAKERSYVRSELIEQGFTPLLPSVWWCPRSEVLLQSFSFLKVSTIKASFFPVREDEVLPSGWEPFRSVETSQLSLQRSLRDLSNVSAELLKEVLEEKKLSHQQKQRIGSSLVSGLSVFQSIVPLQWQSTDILRQSREVAGQLDALARVYLQHRG